MGRPRLPNSVRHVIGSYVHSLDCPPEQGDSDADQDPESVQLDATWLDLMREKMQSELCEQLPKLEPRTIVRVPDYIRCDDGAAYDPTVISIGPYHWNQQHKLNTQKIKWRCLRNLLVRHRHPHQQVSELFDRCLKEMAALMPIAWNCYLEMDSSAEPSPDSEDFAEILLLDGCFILYLLLKQLGDYYQATVRVNEVDGDNDDLWLEDGDLFLDVMKEGKMWIWSMARYDLLKLENQIPFFVINKLFNLLNIQNRENVNLIELSFKLFESIYPQKARDPVKIRIRNVHHLLHLFHLSLLPPSLALAPLSETEAQQPAVKLPEWIPSATELEEAGVRFKCRQDAESFLEIKFTRGVMEIPSLHIYNYSNSLFRNLLAFEHCFPVQPYITAYALFMACIMRAPKDVRLLHLNGIVMNGQGSDEEAARFFDRLCKKIQYAYDTNYLRHLFMDVRKYHESRWHNWWAGLVRDYFSNPWIILSVLGAILLLILTIEQAFFAAYAYFHPPV